MDKFFEVVLVLVTSMAIISLISWIHVYLRGPKYSFGDQVLIIGGFYKSFKGEIQGYDTSALGITYQVKIEFVLPNDEMELTSFKKVYLYKDIYESHVKLLEGGTI